MVPPDFVDGRSLVPLFIEDEPLPLEWRQAMPLEFYGHKVEENETAKPWYLGVRTVDSLYVEYEEDFIEYYDLVNDPDQLENIAQNTDPELLAQFSAWLELMYPSSSKTCRQLENKFING